MGLGEGGMLLLSFGAKVEIMRKKNLAKETSSKCLFDMKINVHRKRKD
jgi:hypothetical protein